MNILNCSKSTLLRIKKQLAEYGLIKEVQQSNSKNGTLANRIYLGSLVTDDVFQTFDDGSSTPVSNLDEGGVKKTLGGCQIQPSPVSESATNETEYKETNNSDNNISFSRMKKIPRNFLILLKLIQHTKKKMRSIFHPNIILSYKWLQINIMASSANKICLRESSKILV